MPPKGQGGKGKGGKGLGKGKAGKKKKKKRPGSDLGGAVHVHVRGGAAAAAGALSSAQNRHRRVQQVALADVAARVALEDAHRAGLRPTRANPLIVTIEAAEPAPHAARARLRRDQAEMDTDAPNADPPAAAAAAPADQGRAGRGRGRLRLRPNVVGEERAGVVREIRDAIGRIQGRLRMGDYNMAGAQSAQTTLRGRERELEVSTTDNKHSEMVGLEHMLDSGEWELANGRVRRRRDGNDVAARDFSTTQPHCGFCTVMLSTLGLPLGTATNRNYNLAVNFNYPLPDAVRTDRDVILRLLNGGQGRPPRTDENKGEDYDEALNRVLRRFLGRADEEVDYGELWEAVVQNPDRLTALWSWIFEAIYRSNEG